MSGDKRLKNDERVDELVKAILGIVKRHGIEPDRRRGQWFATNQLDTVRKIYETQGWKTAKLYQAGKIDARDRPGDLKINTALLEIIDAAAKSGLDRMTVSYTIGKLNSLLALVS